MVELSPTNEDPEARAGALYVGLRIQIIEHMMKLVSYASSIPILKPLLLLGSRFRRDFLNFEP